MPKSNKSSKSSKKTPKQDNEKKKKPAPNLSMMILDAVTKLFRNSMPQEKLSEIKSSIMEKHGNDLRKHLQDSKPLTRSGTHEAKNEETTSDSPKNSSSRKGKKKGSRSLSSEENEITPKRAKVESRNIDIPEEIENTPGNPTTSVNLNPPINLIVPLLLEEEGLKSAQIDSCDIKPFVKSSPANSRKSPKRSRKSAQIDSCDIEPSVKTSPENSRKSPKKSRKSAQIDSCEIQPFVKSSPVNSRKSTIKSAKSARGSGKKDRKLSNKNDEISETNVKADHKETEIIKQRSAVKSSTARSRTSAKKSSATKNISKKLEDRKLSYKKKGTSGKTGGKKVAGKKETKRGTKKTSKRKK